MTTSRLNALDQALDIGGSLAQTSSMTLANEPLQLGAIVAGQSGSAASITTVGTGPTSADVTLTGLTGFTLQNVGNILSISGAQSAGNNGYFLIDGYISDTSVTVVNINGVASDGYNGAISWQEYTPYRLLDDLNYARTDRAAIKGVPYYSPIPTYQRPTAVGTNVPTNLSNIAGWTTDAKSYNVNRSYYTIPVTAGNTKVTITAAGLLKHSDAVNNTGVPVFDAGPFAGDWNSCYVHIVDGYQGGSELSVLSGAHAGERIFGVTYNGSSTSPNSVEIHFYSSPWQDNFAIQNTPYTWESGLDGYISVLYGYNEVLGSMDVNALRTIPSLGIMVDAQLSGEINNIINQIGSTDGYTNLSGLLTNLTADYPFFYLNATPTVVSALNILNQQIGNTEFTGPTTLVNGGTVTQNLQNLGTQLGNTTFTGAGNVDGYTVTQAIEYFNLTIGQYGNFYGPYLQDGYSIAQNLQQLSNSIVASTLTRTIERLTSDINANVAHTLPGGLTYVKDLTNNGQGMFVWTRGLLRDPGTLANNDDYAETSSTQITFFSKMKSGDHINYFIK